MSDFQSCGRRVRKKLMTFFELRFCAALHFEQSLWMASGKSSAMEGKKDKQLSFVFECNELNWIEFFLSLAVHSTITECNWLMLLLRARKRFSLDSSAKRKCWFSVHLVAYTYNTPNYDNYFKLVWFRRKTLKLKMKLLSFARETKAQVAEGALGCCFFCLI